MPNTVAKTNANPGYLYKEANTNARLLWAGRNNVFYYASMDDVVPASEVCYTLIEQDAFDPFYLVT